MKTTGEEEKESLEFYLQPGEIIQSDDPSIHSLAESITSGRTDDAGRARALFYWVRDRISYAMVSPFHRPEYFRPAATVARGVGYCVQKSALMTGLLRAVNVPSLLTPVLSFICAATRVCGAVSSSSRDRVTFTGLPRVNRARTTAVASAISVLFPPNPPPT